MIYETISFSYSLASLKDTQILGKALASICKKPVTIFINGDLGAGKTTLVQHIVAHMDEHIVVQSPTYAYARTYPTSPIIHHLDLYRLTDAKQLLELGLWELLQDPAATLLVEWAENAKEMLMAPDCEIRLSQTHQNQRIAKIIIFEPKLKNLADILNFAKNPCLF